MKLSYEIINPSDPIIMDADDHASATAACVILGAGQLALRARDGCDAPEVPLMLFGDPNPWFQEHFGKSLDAFMGEVRGNPAGCIKALRSVRLEEGAERSSLNDIVGSAKAIAEALEKLEDGRA